MALGRVVPRYPLWLRLQELGWDPVALSSQELMSFHDQHLSHFLADHGLTLRERDARRLRKRLSRFDPRHPTPEETMARLLSPLR